MIRHHFRYRQTITTLLAEEHDHIDAAIDGMLEAREGIERCIEQDPFFALTYSPCPPPIQDRWVGRMCAAAMRADVGPMAAVAGTIAWAGMEAMQREGAVYGVIDNGGDIALVCDRIVTVGIYSGAESGSTQWAFRIPPRDRILGICTSSATVGPSVSFGRADAVTVFAEDVSLADAWATSLCNRTSETDTFGDLVLDPEIQGVLMIQGKDTRSFGTIPPLLRAKVDFDLITRG